ncbi:OsmC family protein [Actinosynnema sp. NPDC020468]|uniref:OsmC family protein n=1 Tax=Actinosynnema sp. NPDC020468 TaxID=3154488 RepID=UPI0033DD15BA
MTTEVQSPLNDVDIKAVGDLVAAVQTDPANARTTWAARVRWKGAFRSEAAVRSFDPTPSDEPTALGGGDTAANPVEQLLGALGNCLAVGYAANATVAGIALDSLTVEVKGNVDLHVFLGLADGHAGFDSITATVRVESDAPRADLESLHEKVIRSSPVGHTLAAAVPVDIRLA